MPSPNEAPACELTPIKLRSGFTDRPAIKNGNDTVAWCLEPFRGIIRKALFK